MKRRDFLKSAAAVPLAPLAAINAPSAGDVLAWAEMPMPERFGGIEDLLENPSPSPDDTQVMCKMIEDFLNKLHRDPDCVCKFKVSSFASKNDVR